MGFYEVLVLVTITGLMVLIYTNPHWPLSRFLISHRGPKPKIKEPLWTYQLRWAKYTFFIALLLLAVGIAPHLLEIYKGMNDNLFVMALLNFIIPMFFLMSAVAAIGFSCTSAWYFVFSRDRMAVLEVPPNQLAQEDAGDAGASG